MEDEQVACSTHLCSLMTRYRNPAPLVLVEIRFEAMLISMLEVKKKLKMSLRVLK